MRVRYSSPGFTLIELLIVVAIIAILAAIALPNFLEAQARAKISRTKSDMRTLATALEAYAVDERTYPQCDNNGWPTWIVQLSTPVAYLATAYCNDPFPNNKGLLSQRVHPYFYYGFNENQCLNTHSAGDLYLPSDATDGSRRITWWMLMSVGPDLLRNTNADGTLVAHSNLISPKAFVSLLYDPSNGTASWGDLIRVGGEVAGASAVAVQATMK